MKIAAEKQTQIIAMAQDLNFYGKRLATAKNAVAENISRAVYGTASKSAQVREFLEENKPVKPAKQRQQREAVEDNRPLESGSIADDFTTWKTLSGKRFILSSIQNNTPAFTAFFENLKKYAQHIGADLLLSEYLYNKNGFQNGSGDKNAIHFNPVFNEYRLNENVFLNNDRFAFMAALNILPTASYPLSGFAETMAAFDLEGMAVGHAQITAESVAVLKGETVRRMYSTGTVTQKNYIQQKAGQKAESQHCFGALIVEFDESGEFFVRQLQAMDEKGDFYDLTTHISSEGITENVPVLALQYGDIHAEKIDLNVANASWGQGGLIDILKPKYQFIHDVHDFTSRNHHNRASGVFLAKQYAAGRDKVLDDIIDTGRILEDMERDYCQTVIVESNHDLALARWLNDPKANITQDPANAVLFHKLNTAVYEAIAEGDESFNVLDYALRQVAGCDFSAVFLETDQSFKLQGIEMGCHGHNGINGSRGAPKQFKKLGKLNTGHTHTASIYGGVYTAGVSGSLDMGYNIGAGSWSHTHLITYPNGQRSLIDFKNGKFFA